MIRPRIILNPINCISYIKKKTFAQYYISHGKPWITAFFLKLFFLRNSVTILFSIFILSQICDNLFFHFYFVTNL